MAIDTILAPVASVTRTPVPDAHSGAQKETLTIQFGDGTEPVEIDASHPQAKLYNDLLAALEPNQLAWLEVDAATRRLQALDIPIVAPVADVFDQPTGDVSVRLVGSPALRTLKTTEPRFAQMRAALREAAGRSVRVALTERDDTREIVNVRSDVRPFDRPLAVPRPLLFNDAVIASFTVISMAQARDAFNHLKGDTACDPEHVNSSCIPFLYPDDGCTGRAHLMCEMLSQLSHRVAGMPDIISGKAFHHSGDPRVTYDVATPNVPGCRAPFFFHCAPVVNVDGAGLQVIDPSFFDGPVPEADWHRIQNAGGPHMIADRVVFYADAPNVGIVFDPVGQQARSALGFARTQLVKRVAAEHRPPPYCP
jgi:hypothetical protein